MRKRVVGWNSHYFTITIKLFYTILLLKILDSIERQSVQIMSKERLRDI